MTIHVCQNGNRIKQQKLLRNFKQRSVRLPVCLSACLCLFVCLCLLVYLSFYLPVSVVMPSCVSVDLLVSVFACLSACMPVCWSTCVSIYWSTCMLSVCWPTCVSVSVCLPACVPVSLCLSACVCPSLCRGGFFLACGNFWEKVGPLIPCLRFFFKVQISSRTFIPLFRPGSVHSA